MRYLIADPGRAPFPASSVLTVSQALVAVGRQKEAVAALDKAAVRTPTLKTSPAVKQAMQKAVVAPP